MAENYIVFCPRCHARNRIPASLWGKQGAVCGKCKTLLPHREAYPDRAVTVQDWNFRQEVLDFPGAVLLEFYSPS